MTPERLLNGGRRPTVIVAGASAPDLVPALESDGYLVLTIASASMAAETCKARKIDLVVSDVIFEYGINGVELAEALSEVAARPQLILFSPFPPAVLSNVPGFPPHDVCFVPTADVPAILDEIRALMAVDYGVP